MNCHFESFCNYYTMLRIYILSVNLLMKMTKNGLCLKGQLDKVQI